MLIHTKQSIWHSLNAGGNGLPVLKGLTMRSGGFQLVKYQRLRKDCGG